MVGICRTLLGSLGVALGLISTTSAGEPVWNLRAGEGVGPAGGSVDISVFLDSSQGGVEAFSFALCTNPEVAIPVEVGPGEALLALNGGEGPAVFETIIANNGVAVTVINSLEPPVDVIPAGENLQLAVIGYALEGPPGSGTEASFCDDIGDPPVPTVLVVEDDEILPDLESGFVGVEGEDPPPDPEGPVFVYSAGEQTVPYDPDTGTASFAVGVTIQKLEGEGETFGFSMSLAHDPELLTATFVEPKGALLELNEGAGPDFFGVTIFSNGVIVGVVYSFTDPEASIPFGEEPQNVLTIQYNAEGLEGEVVDTALVWEGGLGSPPVFNEVVVSFNGETEEPETQNGVVVFVAEEEAQFIRGDCSGDGFYGIGDAFMILGHLFQGLGPVGCDQACDVNDDDMLGLADAMFVLQNLFTTGANPGAPFPECGTDPTAGALGCEEFPACP